MYMKIKQGEKSSQVFGGQGHYLASKTLYTESANYFSEIIKERLSPTKKYVLIDLGSFKGELLSNILKIIPQYNFYTIGVDKDSLSLKENKIVKEKIIGDLSNIPIKDKSADLVIGRYILVWNKETKQKEILNEISRITKVFAIIQHAGADSLCAKEWRKAFDLLFNGENISKLKRENYYFSSRDEIELWMQKSNIKFVRLIERRVNDVIDTLAERFNLNKEEHDKAKHLIKDKNYIIQTTWIIESN